MEKSRCHHCVFWISLLCLISTTVAKPPESSLSANFIENKGQLSPSSSKSADQILFYSSWNGLLLGFRTCGFSVVHTNADSVLRTDVNFSGLSTHTTLRGVGRRESRQNFYYAGSSFEDVQSFSTVRYEDSLNAQWIELSFADGCLVVQHSAPVSSTLLLSRSVHGYCAHVRTHEKDFLSYCAADGSVGFTERIVQSAHDGVELQVLGDDVGVNPPLPDMQLRHKAPRREVTSLVSFSTFYGGSGNDSAYCSATTSNGTLVCGSTTSLNFPTSPGAEKSALQGGTDAFLLSVDFNGRVQWATYWGATGDDHASNCIVSANSVYVVGQTSSTRLSTASVFQSQFGGGSSDGFVAVFDEKSGKQMHCSYVGGSDFDACRAVTALPSGGIAVAGTTMSSDLVATTHQTEIGGSDDAFIIVLSKDLSSRTWSSYYGGRASDEATCIGALSDGSIVVGGNTSSPNSGAKIAANIGEGATPPGGLQTSGFLVRFDPGGTRMWGRYVGGDAYDSLMCLTIRDSRIFVAGFTSSQSGSANNMISSSSFQPAYGGGSFDGFVCTFNADGSRNWGSYVGASGDDRCLGITVSPTKDVIVCGWTDSKDYPLINSPQMTLNGGRDACIAYVSHDGSQRLASAVMGGSADEVATGISYFGENSLMMVGTTSSSDFPTSNAVQANHGGSRDVFIVRLNDLYITSVDDLKTRVPDVAIRVIEDPHQRLHLECADCVIKHIRIYSSIGNSVIDQSGSYSTSASVNIQSLSVGLYAFELLTDNGSVHGCFIIAHY